MGTRQPARAGERSVNRRRLSALLALLAVAGGVAAVLATAGSPSTPGKKDGPNTANTTVVQRRNLAETDTESGTLSYADPRTVYDRLNGTITWLPSAGHVIRPGGTLFTVDGEPVILLDGTMPAYRDLALGVSDGQDVLQLNQNLVDLGFDPGIVLDEQWQAATTTAVKELQASLGESETGKLVLGQVVFLPGSQIVSSVQATLGNGGGSSGSGSPSGTNNPSGAGSPSGKSGPKASGKRQPPGADITSEGPEGGASPTPILQTTSTRLVVTVNLEAGKRSEARVGERVSVELPDGDATNGRVIAVSRVAQPTTSNDGGENGSGEQGNGGSGNSGSTVPVTIALTGRNVGAALDQAVVSVNFTQAFARHVLSVPVTALLATPGAGYAIEQAAPPQRLIPVSTGLFAAGYVQISGAGIQPGLRVSNAQG